MPEIIQTTGNPRLDDELDLLHKKIALINASSTESVVQDSSIPLQFPIPPIVVTPNTGSAASNNISTLIRKLMTLRSDATIVVISDSTGNGSTGSSIRFIYQLAGLVAPLWTRHTHEFYQWATTDYGAAATLQTGTSGFKLKWYNCAVSGKTTAYTMGDKWANAVASKAPDLIIINHGHNQQSYTTNDESFRQNVSGSMRNLIEMLRVSAPNAGIIINIQNPTKVVAGVGQQIRAGVYSALANMTGVGTVDTMSLFLNPDGSVIDSLLADDVHPTNAGARLQANQWLPLFNPRDAYESSSLQPPANTIVGKSLILDPYLFYTPASPLLQSSANVTLDRDITYIDSASVSSLKITATASTQGSIVLNSAVPVSKLAGKWVTAWIREYLPAGIYTSAGRIAIGDGTQSVVSDAPAAEATDGWITHCVSFPVATTGATYLRLTIYAGRTTETPYTKMYVSEIHWVEGRNPHLSAPRPNTTPAPANLVPASAIPAYDFNGTTSTAIAPNNAVFNFGTSDFSVGLMVTLRSLAPSAEMPIVNCFSGWYGWKLSLTTGGLLQLSIGNTSSAFTAYVSTSAVSNLMGVGVPTPILVTITRTGNVVFYVNGQQLGAKVDISAQSANTVDQSATLKVGYDGTLYASMLVNTVALFNGVVDTSSIGAHGVNLTAKYAGAIAYQSNFSAGTDSWVHTNATLAGNVDGVSDGTDTKYDVLSVTCDGVGSIAHLGGKYNIVSGSKLYRLAITYYIPTAAPTLKALRLYTQTGTSMASLYADMAVTGTWTTVTADFTNASGNTGFQLRGLDVSNSTTWTAVAGDVFYISNMTVTEVGAVVAYEAYPPAMTSVAWLQGNTAVSGADLAITSALPNFPMDATLLALSNLNATAGLVAQTGTDTFTKRTLTGTANQVIVTNGDGVSGNPTFTLPQSIGTGNSPEFTGLTLSGLTASRFVKTDGSKALVSASTVNLTSEVTGVLPVANGGTNATAFTAGSIVFAGTSGTYKEDNANFFWDDTNNRLGIGITSPMRMIDVYNAGAVADIRLRSGAGNCSFYIDSVAGNVSRLRFVTSQLFAIRDETAGIDRLFIQNSGNIGIGTGSTVSNRLHVIDTATQARFGYDTSNYLTIDVSSAGVVTFDAVGASAGFTFSDSVTIADAKNIILNTTTGTKIGTATTQKLGFYNATPIVQRSGAAQAALATTASTNVAPYGFTTAAQADSIITLANEVRAWAVAQGFWAGS